MNFSSPSLRAPAESPKFSLASATKAAIGALITPFTVCRHGNVTLPYSNRQTCLDCGASRAYRFTRQGIATGPWRKVMPAAQTAQTVLAQTNNLMDRWIAAGEAVQG